jgi:glycosyltransferase involved in cell wall biosynthesis
VPTATSAERPAGRPRVRFLAHGAERSGPPIALLRWLRAWRIDDPGFDTEVVIGRTGPLAPEYAALCELRTAGLDRRSPEQLVARGFDAVGLAPLGRRVRAAATRQRVGDRPADLIVVNGATADGVELLRTTPQAPTVLIAHELSTGWMANLSADDRHLLLARTTAYLAVSDAVRSYLVEHQGVDPASVQVTPPPVDVPDCPPDRGRRDRGRCVVVGGGVADWRKAPELFVTVAHHCREQAPEIDWAFRWFGGGTGTDPAAWPLHLEVERLGLASTVTFTGPLEDVGAELAGGDLFLLTAKEDAAPLVAAEAAGAGLPIATFDSGGVEELVREGRCGVVVPYPDVPGLAAAVVDLARDPERRLRAGRDGADLVRSQRSSAVVADDVAAWIRGTLSP